MGSLNKLKGLETFKNEYSEVSEGALVVAKNVVIDRDSIIEPRRGFKTYGTELPLSTDRLKQLLTYKDRVLRHYDTVLQFDSDGSGTFQDFDGSYQEVQSGLRIKYVESNSNMYFTTSSGIKKISANTSSSFSTSPGYILDAGGPEGLDIEGVAVVSATGFMAPDSAVAYRIVWGYKDANENLILGAPSTRVIVRNTAVVNQADVDLETTIPNEVTVDYFYQLYRTANTTDSSSEPGDEMNLVDERYPTSTDITNGYISISDITPDDFRVGGTLLYTNSISGNGILSANEKPPIATDIAMFKNSIFYANTKTLHKSQFGLIGVSLYTSNSSSFIVGNSTSVREYVFRNAGDGGENTATQKVFLSSSISAAQAVDETARSLVKVINRDPSNIVYAYYLSGPDDVPGLILLKNKELTDDVFYIATNDAAIKDSFSPSLPVDATPSAPFTSDFGSDNEVSPNRVYYSKFQQPEAVPIINYLDIGPKDEAIERIVSLRDSLFVLKTDGIYRITGSSADSGFGVTLFDGTTTIIAPDTATTSNNQLLFLSESGVVTASESGVSIISRDIEDLINKVTTRNTSFNTAGFAVGYDSDKAYLLWLPTRSSDTVATQVFRFNSFTRTWTTWDLTNTCGVVNRKTDKLYIGSGTTNTLKEERKSFTTQDAADEEFSSVILPSDITTGTVLVNSVSGYVVGDVLSQTQKLTISKLNRLLKKLDLDPTVDDADYYTSITPYAGADISLNIIALATKLDADSGVTDTDYLSSISGLSDFTSIQNDYNIIVNKLNTDTGVTYSNYSVSTGTITFNALIRSISTINNSVTLSFYLPLMAGDTTIFKAIETEVQFAPQTFGDPSILKQVSEGTFMFESNSFTLATLSYSSDLNPGFVDVAFEANGQGFWGMFDWGETNWGGEGNQAAIRTLVPLESQRCRIINVKFKHTNALEQYAILGISLKPRTLSERAYK